MTCEWVWELMDRVPSRNLGGLKFRSIRSTLLPSALALSCACTIGELVGCPVSL